MSSFLGHSSAAVTVYQKALSFAFSLDRQSQARNGRIVADFYLSLCMVRSRPKGYREA